MLNPKNKEEVDYLTEDQVISEQKYMCISFLKPSQIAEKNRPKDLSVCGVKVRGCYSTYEEAQKRANFLQKSDPYHNIYIGEVGKWCPFEDNPEKAKDTEYMNKDLNKLMKTYWSQQEEAKEFHELRKQEMVKKAIDEAEKKKNQEDDNQSNLDATSKTKKSKTKKSKTDKLNELQNDLEEDKTKVETEKREVDENIKKLRALEEELAEKMREMELEEAKRKVETMNKTE